MPPSFKNNNRSKTGNIISTLFENIKNLDPKTNDKLSEELEKFNKDDLKIDISRSAINYYYSKKLQALYETICESFDEETSKSFLENYLPSNPIGYKLLVQNNLKDINNYLQGNMPENKTGKYKFIVYALANSPEMVAQSLQAVSEKNLHKENAKHKDSTKAKKPDFYLPDGLNSEGLKLFRNKVQVQREAIQFKYIFKSSSKEKSGSDNKKIKSTLTEKFLLWFELNFRKAFFPKLWNMGPKGLYEASNDFLVKIESLLDTPKKSQLIKSDHNLQDLIGSQGKIPTPDNSDQSGNTSEQESETKISACKGKEEQKAPDTPQKIVQLLANAPTLPDTPKKLTQTAQIYLPDTPPIVASQVNPELPETPNKVSKQDRSKISLFDKDNLVRSLFKKENKESKENILDVSNQDQGNAPTVFK